MSLAMLFGFPCLVGIAIYIVLCCGDREEDVVSLVLASSAGGLAAIIRGVCPRCQAKGQISSSCVFTC
ncbi:hypothetical protein V1506DRAFT_548592 [Lipomyces tetrasporus]